MDDKRLDLNGCKALVLCFVLCYFSFPVTMQDSRAAMTEIRNNPPNTCKDNLKVGSPNKFDVAGRVR